jgi:hypothetical protein
VEKLVFEDFYMSKLEKRELDRTLESISRTKEKYDVSDALQESIARVAIQLEMKPDGFTSQIPIDYIDVTRNEVRKTAIEETTFSFEQLKHSILNDGLNHPPTVYVEQDRIYCLTGHRRIAAIKAIRKEFGDEKTISGVVWKSGILFVDVRVRKRQGASIHASQLMENLAREDLSVLDQAEGYARLRQDGESQKSLAVRAGKDRSSIVRFLKIASWPEEAKSMIRAHESLFGRTLLFDIARQSLTGEQIIARLKAAIEGKPITAPSKFDRMLKRVEQVFNENNYSNDQKDLILTFLVQLELLPDRFPSAHL